MKGTNSSGAGSDGARRIDDILRGITDIRRRYVLFHLRQNGSATVDELVDVVATGIGTESSDVDVKGIRNILFHIDLPLLEELSLIVVDREVGVVSLTADPRELGEWLDLAISTDIRVESTTPAGRGDAGGEISVLLVDDSPAITELIEEYFARHHDDLSTTTVTNVEEAVDALREMTIDCIVSDLKMPALSGMDFLKAVREEDPEIPFIMFTARGSEAAASEAIANNVTGYVLKSGDPEQFDSLATQIRTAVEPAEVY